MLKDKSLTYISLFSSAGVGCYGFEMEGFHCIATNEIIPRRIEVQKYNHKCDFQTGYVCGDITEKETKDRIYAEIRRWAEIGNDKVDVLIATPPCQGISVINHKKNKHDINRNSLVVESVEMVRKIMPRVFIFENVQAFQKTYCITKDNQLRRIGDHIRDELGKEYIITGLVLNFMHYGANSSRTRTLVVGISNEYKNTFIPYDLFPMYRQEKTLREVIGNMPRLEWGEIDPEDFYHAFRTYNPVMRPWIHDLKEGESAFDNTNPVKRPHHIVNGKIVENVRKNRDKYTRQKWDRFVQCVHTRNDQLAAQNTIHPVEDRVFSIRELMQMMTIPKDFRWVGESLEVLNALPDQEKRRIYSENELNIRQCIGEAIPTEIMRQIAAKLKTELSLKKIPPIALNKMINRYDLNNRDKLNAFILENPEHLEIPMLQRIIELCNARREETAAYYTNKFIINEIMDILPDFNKKEIRIIEPSVGAGSFIPSLIKRYEDVEKVTLDVIDIDEDSIVTLKLLLKQMDIPSNFRINIIHEDFLLFTPCCRYDIAVGNPPYSKLKNPSPEVSLRLRANVNKTTRNLSEMFLEKCMIIADITALVMNKTLLSSREFDSTRELLRHRKIEAIIDFGRYGFTGLSIETMCLMVSSKGRPSETFIYNMKYNFRIMQKQDRITDPALPYFVIYRNDEFDQVAEKLEFDVFDVFRDRQITKSNTTTEREEDSLRVIKARNITDDGEIKDIKGYDTYISRDTCQKLSVMKYVGNTSVYLTPNMTYNPRLMKNRDGIVPDGSVAVLIPKKPLRLTQEQIDYFSTDEYRRFYLIARNLSTQSINVDAKSVYFYGIKRGEINHDTESSLAVS